MELCCILMKYQKEKIKVRFSYDSMKNADYTELKKSEKFTPALYHEKDGIWKGAVQASFHR